MDNKVLTQGDKEFDGSQIKSLEDMWAIIETVMEVNIKIYKDLLQI
jgi:hypothetical protein